MLPQASRWFSEMVLRFNEAILRKERRYIKSVFDHEIGDMQDLLIGKRELDESLLVVA